MFSLASNPLNTKPLCAVLLLPAAVNIARGAGSGCLRRMWHEWLASDASLHYQQSPVPSGSPSRLEICRDGGSDCSDATAAAAAYGVLLRMLLLPSVSGWLLCVTFCSRLAAALPSAALANKWEVHWAVLNNIGGGIQLLLPPLQPLFLANLSIHICARCSDGHHYSVRYSAAEATGGRHAWDPILRRVNLEDDAYHDLGCGRFVFATLPSTAHSLPVSAEFAPRSSREFRARGHNALCDV